MGVSRFSSQVAHPVRHCPHPSLPGHLIRIFHENKIELERMKNVFKVRLCTKNKQTYQLVITHPILKPYFEICILPDLVYNSLSMSYHNAKHTVQSYTAKSSNICEYFNQAWTTHLKPWHRLSVSLSDVALQRGLDLLAVIHLRFTRLVTWKTNQKSWGNWTFISWDPWNCTNYQFMYRVP